mmetsp:Transcript_77562/g.186053  ORF Transcript_77562/g.186053 Transcript_77562/m.186053 type:complete len:227 (+) Transcript_77562:25-705(+)
MPSKKPEALASSNAKITTRSAMLLQEDPERIQEFAPGRFRMGREPAASSLWKQPLSRSLVSVDCTHLFLCAASTMMDPSSQKESCSKSGEVAGIPGLLRAAAGGSPQLSTKACRLPIPSIASFWSMSCTHLSATKAAVSSDSASDPALVSSTKGNGVSNTASKRPSSKPSWCKCGGSIRLTRNLPRSRTWAERARSAGRKSSTFMQTPRSSHACSQQTRRPPCTAY